MKPDSLSAKKRLVLVGGGGHCRSCIEVIEGLDSWVIEGIIDIRSRQGMVVSGYYVIGDDDHLASLALDPERSFVIAIGQIKDCAGRKGMYAKLAECGAALASIVAASSRVSARATIGAGTVIMANAVVNAGVQIGVNGIINTGAIIEHDARIGDHCHISTGAIVNGAATVGDECFIGSGAILANGISVVSNSVIGAGSVVVRSVTEPGTYVGNPAKRMG